MNYRRIISFLLNLVFNILFISLGIYLLYTVVTKSYDTGKELTSVDPNAPEKSIIVTIPDGADVNQVAEILEEEGVINSSIMFVLESTLKGDSKEFEGGEYTLNTKMDAAEVVNALRKKNLNSTDIIVTIKEGYTIKNIAEALENEGLFTAEEFISVANNAHFDYPFIKDIPERENRLEGYLFPDTYYLAPNSSPETVIKKMLNRFGQIYSKYEGQAEKLGLTMDEVIIVASIIEKEIRVDEERPKAAEVIYNRLESEQNLQMCSTVLYVLDKRKDRLYEEDLKIESPYNTYVNNGLPIGPISNPGEACIKAAVNPGEGDLLYFVVKDEETGEHYFTDNYDDFLKAKEIYKQKF